jgi:hypothetical protein
MRLFLPGQRRTLTIELPGVSVGSARELARSSSGRSVDRVDRPRIRLGPDGRVRCHLPSTYRHANPRFDGVLRDGDAGAVLSGQVREARSEGFLTALYSVLTIPMAVGAVWSAIAGIVPTLVICAVGAIAFGILSVTLRAARVTVFRRDLADLDAALRRSFGAPLAHPEP